MNPKVSVIVPIYNVEKYLPRCIESIVKQTYNNLEVILVNDGSPDQCGTVAENFAKNDQRIKVLHKENGGLSDARNYGMQYVTGDYIFFVDSDDWLHKKIIKELVQAASTFQAEVVQSAFYYAYDDFLEFDSRVYNKGKPPEIYDNKMLMKELVKNEKVKNFAWGKLYKTEIIKDIPFKKGVLFEDVFWAHKVMQRVKRFVSINDPLYYYYQRADSIVAMYTSRNLDIIKGLIERHQFIEKNYIDLTDESYKVILKTILIHYNLLLRNKKKDQKGIYRKELQQYIYKNYVSLKKSTGKDQHLKRELILFKVHPYLNISFLLFQKILRKIKLVSQPAGLERIELEQKDHLIK